MEAFITFEDTLSRLVSKPVELTIAGLSRGMLCGGDDAGKAERCAEDAAATPIFSSCGADNNGIIFDLLEEIQDGVESAVGFLIVDEVVTATVVDRKSVV